MFYVFNGKPKKKRKNFCNFLFYSNKIIKLRLDVNTVAEQSDSFKRKWEKVGLVGVLDTPSNILAPITENTIFKIENFVMHRIYHSAFYIEYILVWSDQYVIITIP